MTMATAVYKNKIMFADAEATTLDDARSELAYIFQYNQDDLCDDRSHVTHTALALLATWPALAYDEFHADEDVDYTFLPLSIFVAAGADLTIISLLHKLNPDAAKTCHPVLKLYPLQTACEVHADRDVLIFLALQYPDAVTTRDYKGDLIIHSVLDQGKADIPKRSTIELLLQWNPQSVQMKSNFDDGSCPLGIAFRAGQTTKIVEKIIAERIRQHITHFEIGSWKNYVLDWKGSSRLVHELLPKLFLTSFTCEPESYTTEGFVHLVEYLVKDYRIEELTLSLPLMVTNTNTTTNNSISNRNSNNGCNEGESFLRFLRLNSTVRELSLSRKELPAMTIKNGTNILLEGLRGNETLESLSISGLFVMQSKELGILIASAPETLVIEHLMIEKKWKSKNTLHWGTSKLKNFTIRNPKMRGDILEKLLGALPMLYGLRKLELDFSGPQTDNDLKFLMDDRDVTPGLIALLEKNRLRSLIIKGLNVEIRALSWILHTNSSLRVLHVDTKLNELPMKVQCLLTALEHNNTTLEDIRFHCDYQLEEQLADDSDDGAGRRSKHGVGVTFKYVTDPAIQFFTQRNRALKREKLRQVTIH